MNKNAIKKFAIEARNKLRASVADKAGMLGITEAGCNAAETKGADFEVYRTAVDTQVTLNKKQSEQRRKLVQQIERRGYDAVIEEVAYTWFNRICAIRFMEVNDYLPTRVRVLSSEKAGKNDPDIVTAAPNIDLDLTEQDRADILDHKASGDTDWLFRMLFIKQCNKLSEILPELFEATEDYTEMLFNISYTNRDDVIQMLIGEGGIPEQDFNVSFKNEDGTVSGQVEIIGWLYQYYNTELKDDTFAKLKKNIKISKERIPAATQLFTPDWIVRYMVENSVGRLWIEHLRVLDSNTDEKAMAEKFGWKYYLPEAEQEPEVNVELAEIRTSYKDMEPEDILCIDPCMGSGHILIAMFDVLMDIYKSVGYSEREAAFLIVENNIHGLDIDKRAYQLAYFAVMMKGRGYNRKFLSEKENENGERKPISPQVYVIEESNRIKRTQLKYFGAVLNEIEKNNAINQMNGLLDQLEDATEYGSILNIDNFNWELLKSFVKDYSVSGQLDFDTVGIDETQEKLERLVEIGEIMAKKYDAVVTNPPYMGGRNMSHKLSDFIKREYEDYKADLFSAFIVHCTNMVRKHGYSGFLTPYVWMFIQSYEKMRKYIYDNKTIETLIQFEYSAFEEATVPICTFVLKNRQTNKKGGYFRLSNFRGGMEIQRKKTLEAISNHKCGFYYESNSIKYRKIPGLPVAYWISENYIRVFEKGRLLGDIADSKQGIATADNNRFLREWYEVAYGNIKFDCLGHEQSNLAHQKWYPYNKGGEFRKWYGNNDYVLNWKNDGAELKEFKNSVIRNPSFMFRSSITWSDITSSTNAFRYKPSGFLFDVCGMSLFSEKDSLYLLALCNSAVIVSIIKIIAPTMHCQCGDVANIPVIIDENLKPKIEKLVQENVNRSKKDWDSFEISWHFETHPFIMALKENRKFVQNGILKGRNPNLIRDCYIQWGTDCNLRFSALKKNEEELNRIFIGIYGLQDELTPEVKDKDVTVRKADLSRDIRSLLSYAVGCMFGRYSVAEEGLIYAGGDFEEKYALYTGTFDDTADYNMDGKYTLGELGSRFYYLKAENKKALECYKVDYDNIIPITDEEYFQDDIVGLFCDWLKKVYGADTLEENLDFIAEALGNKGDTSREIIRNYFLNDFMADHLKIYQKRPIYWLFDSGKAGSFKALIYLHRYNQDTVGTVRTEYLHKTQKSIEQALERAEYISTNGTGSEKAKATKQITKYTKQLAEIRIYDEAMAHIANQRIAIDLDDGVKVNYAKFQGVEVAQEGKKTVKVDLLAKIK